MADMDITNAKAKKLNELEDSALLILQSFVDEKRDCDDVVKGSLKIVNMVAKNRQTTTHKKAIEFSMAASIATEEQKKKYIAATSPHVLKALTGSSPAGE